VQKQSSSFDFFVFFLIVSIGGGGEAACCSVGPRSFRIPALLRALFGASTTWLHLCLWRCWWWP